MDNRAHDGGARFLYALVKLACSRAALLAAACRAAAPAVRDAPSAASSAPPVPHTARASERASSLASHAAAQTTAAAASFTAATASRADFNHALAISIHIEAAAATTAVGVRSQSRSGICTPLYGGRLGNLGLHRPGRLGAEAAGDSTGKSGGRGCPSTRSAAMSLRGESAGSAVGLNDRSLAQSVESTIVQSLQACSTSGITLFMCGDWASPGAWEGCAPCSKASIVCSARSWMQPGDTDVDGALLIVDVAPR
mmetsp:Transcript_3577/g.10000  ORF Transcript_3577/g.10000 Transcript_3577/m.10000 type:complete len:254 (+) Transcript_3577:688-1449(+)